MILLFSFHDGSEENPDSAGIGSAPTEHGSDERGCSFFFPWPDEAVFLQGGVSRCEWRCAVVAQRLSVGGDDESSDSDESMNDSETVGIEMESDPLWLNLIINISCRMRMSYVFLHPDLSHGLERMNPMTTTTHGNTILFERKVSWRSGSWMAVALSMTWRPWWKFGLKTKFLFIKKGLQR